MEYLVPVAVIPGPKSPKSIDSFMIPLIDECIALAHGIRTYDTLTKQNFMLHAYLLTFSGDLPAMSKVLCLKGHNGFCPCRYCLITGSLLGTTYYPVLTPPRIPGQVRNKWDPRNLPLRTRQIHIRHLTEINQIIGQQRQDDLSIQYGVHRLSFIMRIPSLQLPISFPHDIMHLFFENICPTLCDQWTGSRKFKNKPPVDPGYRIAPHIWQLIGRETAEAYSTIPSEFVGALPDISTSKYKAEFWSFWVQYLGPVLLRNRFPNDKYYRHFCDLVAIIKVCLRFTISHTEIDQLQDAIIKWVEEYERWVWYSVEV
jgi:hypothetical protein